MIKHFTLIVNKFSNIILPGTTETAKKPYYMIISFNLPLNKVCEANLVLQVHIEA